MIQITNRFLFFLTNEAFLKALASARIGGESIVFIKDRGIIWTHGEEFGGKEADLSSYATKVWTNEAIEEAFRGVNANLEKAKGYFSSIEILNYLVPNPKIGEWAIVDTADGTWRIAICEIEGTWTLTNREYEHQDVNLTEYAKKTDLDGYLTEDDLGDYAKKSDLDPYATKNQISEIASSIGPQPYSIEVAYGKNNIIISLRDRDNKKINSCEKVINRAEEGLAGVMSAYMYKLVNKIPSLEESINNITSALGDDDFDEILAKYEEIKEFIENLDSSDVNSIIAAITAETARATAVEEALSNEIDLLDDEITSLKNRVRNLEDNPAGSVTVNTDIPIVDHDHNGLMSTTMYDTLMSLRDTTIPQIQQDIESIQYLINQDNPDITEIIEKFRHIAEFIESLGNSEGQAILDNIIQRIAELESALLTETNRATRAEQDLFDRIDYEAGREKTHHIFLTLSEYDALTSYEKDAIYMVMENPIRRWHFGDVFPITFNNL